MAQDLRESAESDAFWMRRALSEAELGRGSVEPNPLVGAVIVRDGRALAVGHHARFGGPHAEVDALSRAGDSARGATLYVTLEPCRHHGKTPPCTEAVLHSGIARVVAAMRDPFPKVAGGGLAQLRAAGLEVNLGVEGDSARRLNAPYLKRLRTGRPYVTAKWAMTLDGRIATSKGDSVWISGPRSRALVHEVRGRMDAILVGIGTVLADNPSLTARPSGPRIAARVILDSEARLPFTSRLAATARDVPVWVAVTERAAAERTEALSSLGCEVLKFQSGGGRIPIAALLDELGRRGATNLLVEGGGQTIGAFLDAREIDAVDVFIAPILEGGTTSVSPVLGNGVSAMADALRLRRPLVTLVEGDVRIRGVMPGSGEGGHDNDST